MGNSKCGRFASGCRGARAFVFHSAFQIPNEPMKNTLPDNERTRCEVWTRVMGYHRPVSQFNAGKQSEHRERTPFREERTTLRRAA